MSIRLTESGIEAGKQRFQLMHNVSMFVWDLIPKHQKDEVAEFATQRKYIKNIPRKTLLDCG